jgi:DNA end-binding protein Ku
MRAIWKGAVSFGLVSIPVRLYTATEERDVHFHQVHREDAGRIRYRRVCQLDGTEVPYSDIAKGYELPSGEIVILTDEDFQELPLPTSRIVDVLEFVPLAQVDPIYFAKSYYLEPDKQGVKPYILLRDALQRSEMVALVKVAIRTRETLGTLRVRDRVLVLETMVWPDEVRTPDFAFLDEDVSARPQELSMAESLISSMSGDFDPSQYRDEYREALEQVIEAKIQGRHVVEPERREAAPAERAVDLMAALRRSVEEARRRRGEPAAEEEQAAAAGGGAATAGTGRKAGAARAPAKKAARKAPAKTPAKKTPAKKETAKAAPKKAAAKEGRKGERRSA